MRRAVIEAIIRRLEVELSATEAAARVAHEAATHAESKPEDQYDTRGLEASYLAGAQAKRADELARTLYMYRQLLAEVDRPPSPTIAPGSLIELKLGNKNSFYYLVLEGGGMTVEADGRSVQVITPKAPLGEALLGRRAGDEIEVEIQGSIREYEVIHVHS